MPTSLRVENLWKSYTAGVRGCSARVWALRGCSLIVRAGDRVAIAGRPGAGKSTLLQCIAGLRRPDGGRVESDFTRVVYVTGTPLAVALGAPPQPGTTLYLVDDIAISENPDAHAVLAQWNDRRSAIVVATRNLAQVAGCMERIFTLREGRLASLPRTPIRRVAERLHLDVTPLCDTRAPSAPETVRE